MAAKNQTSLGDNQGTYTSQKKIDRTLISAVVIAAMLSVGAYLYIKNSSMKYYQEVNQAAVIK